MASEHEVVFQWPHTEPAHVVVTGTFDQWSGSHPLTKTPTGFKGTVHIPWGAKVLYKFIVDGTWLVHEDQPTEADHDGNVNNVYSAPPAPAPLPVSVIAPQTHGVGADKEEEAVKAPNGKPRDEELESPFVSPAVPGAFPKTPVVVVPAPEVVNEPETPAPAPAPEPTPISVAPVKEPKAPEPATPAPAPAPAAEEKPKAPEPQPATIPIPSPGPVAPRVPIPIVPVNAAENNPPVSPVDVSPSAKEVGGKEREGEVSTHAYSPTPRSPVLSPTAVEKKPEPAVAAVEPVPGPEPVSVPLPPSEAVTPPPAPVAEAAVPKVEKAAPAEQKGEAAGAGNGTAAEEAKSSTNGHSETSSPARPSTPVKKAVFPSSGPSPSRGGSPTGTASSSRKKRTSIFGKLKHVFHHDHDKETK